MQIIPAIDIIEGKCVRLTQGDYAQKKVYHEDPLEVAKKFEGFGLQRLHLVDLDGAKAGEVVNWKVLEKIANKTNLIIDFGGGIKSEATLKTVLDTGATYATIGSLAVKSPAVFEQWLSKFGASSFLLGADVYEEKIAIGGFETTLSASIVVNKSNFVPPAVGTKITVNDRLRRVIAVNEDAISYTLHLENINR